MSSRNLLNELDYSNVTSSNCSFTIELSSVSAPVLVRVMASSPQTAYRYCPSLLVGWIGQGDHRGRQGRTGTI